MWLFSCTCHLKTIYLTCPPFFFFFKGKLSSTYHSPFLAYQNSSGKSSKLRIENLGHNSSFASYLSLAKSLKFCELQCACLKHMPRRVGPVSVFLWHTFAYHILCSRCGILLPVPTFCSLSLPLEIYSVFLTSPFGILSICPGPSQASFLLCGLILIFLHQNWFFFILRCIIHLGFQPDGKRWLF